MAIIFVQNKFIGVIMSLKFGCKKNKSFLSITLLTVFIFFCTLYLNSQTNKLLNENCSFQDGTHTYYLYSSSSNAKIINYDINDSVNLNSFCIKVESLFLSFQNGESAVNEYIALLLKEYNAKSQGIESGNFGRGEYYYSNKIPSFVIIGGKRVNVHVVKNTSGITIGTPLIFGSF